MNDFSDNDVLREIIQKENLPPELVATPRWVVWHVKPRGEERFAKVPVDKNGNPVNANDAGNWSPFDEALLHAPRDPARGGIGFVFTEDDDIGGVDLDACRDPETGELTTWAKQLLDTFRNAYAEVSPSGTGVKIFAKGAPPELPSSVQPVDGEPIRGKAPQIEAYVTGHYFTVTGQRLEGAPASLGEPHQTGPAWMKLCRNLKLFAEDLSSEAEAPTTTSFDAELLRDALRCIPADDYETWCTVIRAVKLSAEEMGYPDEEAKALVREWSAASEKYDERDFEEKWARGFKRTGGRVQRLGSVFKLAYDYGWRRPGALGVEDFYAFMPQHNYIYAPTRDFWPASSVNARVPKVPTAHGAEAPADWLDRHRAVEQLTWYPGEPEVIEDRLIADGGWIERRGAKCFNLYRPPTPRHGDASRAGPWREHLKRLYPEEHRHLEQWLAHRVQRPSEKINHGVILGGRPGVGKDTLLVPVRAAVGDWNFQEVSPVQLVGRFNGFLKAVVLRVSEARDLGGNDLSATNRYQLYEHMKVFTAAPPEVLRIDEKHLREYPIPNVVGLVITTNYQDGVYLPPDDRRFYVAWSEAQKEDFAEAYWTDLYRWYEKGGAAHVAAYLAELDLSEFDAKAPPPKTAAFWAMVDAGRDPEESRIADALDHVGHPDAIILSELTTHAEYNDPELHSLLTDKKTARRVPHLMDKAGYVRVTNDSDKTGKFVINGKRQTIYAKRELTPRGRLEAAKALKWSREKGRRVQRNLELNRPTPTEEKDDAPF